jgi:hypothetical protein
MEEFVWTLHEEVIAVLGGGEELEGECETTSCYTIAKLYPTYRDQLKKVKGLFQDSGHFWIEINGHIIDLSVEQFGVPFEYPVSKERGDLYQAVEKQKVDYALYEESVYLAHISDLNV